MATTDLKLDEPGTLLRPGPIGRGVRLLLGALGLRYVSGLIQVTDNVVGANGIRTVIWNGIVPSLFLVSYIINIGFSRAWKKWPAIVSAGFLLVVAGIGYFTSGRVDTELLGNVIWSRELYLFSHLGLAFVVAGLIGTPGCEMRAFHDLYSRFTGVPTKEHYCPVGPLTPIDRWEAGRSMGGRSRIVT